MPQDRTNMNLSSFPHCPHIGGQHVTFADIKKLDKVHSCSSCDYAGPNLWVCLQRNCLRVGCSEQANDHSTEHFQHNKSHCVHVNMSSQRAWCYLCEREVFLGIKRSSQRNDDLFTTSTSTSLKHDSIESSGLVGLQNIANTCYMNSALQALSNVKPMTYYFLNCGDLVEHIAEQGAHRNKAGLAKSYQRLMQDIWCKSSVGKDYIAPRGILYGIRSVHPMFRGFQQHDTQEFLRCFMDQLHEELKEPNHMSPFFCGPRPSTVVDNSLNFEDDRSSSTSKPPSRSGSLSESEYETCDSSVSEQSNLNDSIAPHLTQLHGNCGARPNRTSIASQVPVRSIISDIFDGKLLSSVQCLTCDRISTREETFQDLSLPIPNRDYLNVLHQTHSFSSQSLNSIDSASTRSGDSWFAWMWNMVRSWIWGPSVTLHDCMASFFSADELKGDNMYSCEKCNKLRTGVKYSQILDLPEVICIHLKRFRHDLSYSSKISSHVNFPLEGFDMRPYLHKHCTSGFALYNLVSVICHHGTVGGGHYTCFARNTTCNRWYEYDDQHVTEVPADIVQNCQAYVLFYARHNPQMELIRAEASELSSTNPVHMADIRFYVAREWLSRFNTFAEPGPINNWAMLCPHGGILQSKIALLSQIAVPISQPLWDFLYGKFGGGPAINMLFECEVCKRAAEALARRQYYELAVFTKYNGMDADIDSSAIFAISMPWLRKWQQFSRGITHKEPGPINNANIVASADAICNVRTGSDYAQLNAPLWRFLHGIYGGGPEIILRGSEEIEIIDQDEYDRDSCVGNPDLSDTESNIGENHTVDLSTREPVELHNSLELEHTEVNRIGESSKTHPSARDTKHKHLTTSSKKSKSAALRSSLRKKTMKSRNAMKNADFFGPKGSYNLYRGSDTTTEGVPTEDLDAHYTEEVRTKRRDAFTKHSKQSLHSEKKVAKRNQFKISLSEDRENHNSEIPSSRGGARKIKGKNAILLQKTSQFRQSADDSIETDV